MLRRGARRVVQAAQRAAVASQGTRASAAFASLFSARRPFYSGYDHRAPHTLLKSLQELGKSMRNVEGFYKPGVFSFSNEVSLIPLMSSDKKQQDEEVKRILIKYRSVGPLSKELTRFSELYFDSNFIRLQDYLIHAVEFAKKQVLDVEDYLSSAFELLAKIRECTSEAALDKVMQDLNGAEKFLLFSKGGLSQYDGQSWETMKAQLKMFLEKREERSTFTR